MLMGRQPDILTISAIEHLAIGNVSSQLRHCIITAKDCYPIQPHDKETTGLGSATRHFDNFGNTLSCLRQCNIPTLAFFIIAAKNI